MKKLMLGFVFIFLNFTLNLNGVSLDLLPAFVGFILLYFGLCEMMTEVSRYRKLRPFCIGMAIFEGIVWICDLTGLTAVMADFAVGTEALYLLVTLALTIISYYITYQVVAGVEDIEKANQYLLRANRLENAWIVMVICHIAMTASSAFGIFGYAAFYALALPFAIASFVVIICFLVFFNKTKNEYYKMKTVKAQEETMAEYLAFQAGNEEKENL